MGTKHRVLIADDHVLFADSLKIVISMRAHDLEVVAVAYDGAEAIDLVDKLAPDIVLMDVRMPKVDGVEATRVIRERHPDVKIMMLTTFGDDRYVYDALRNGAEAYLLKDISPNELISSIRATLNGTILISPSVASKVISQGYSASRQGPRAGGGQAPSHVLSERDRQLLELIAEGLDNRAIADRLYLAEQTVKNRVSDIYSRLGVHNRVQAIRKLRPDREPVYVILDNLNHHRGPDLRKWCADNDVELCFTPTYASWANPIEAHFGPLRQFVIANSDHENHPALTKALASLYGYTSDEKGIRHPLLASDVSKVHMHEAVFMYGACAAFITYLIARARDGGLLNR